MDLQTYLNAATKKMRDASFADSPQLTLGELLALLKNIPTKSGDEAVTVEFDFGTAYPDGLSSWRGSYSELAINYALCGYDDWQGKDSQFNHTDLADFVKMLEEAVGRTYEGWKGGDYVMSLDTPIWVANNGNAGNTGVVGVLNKDYVVIIQTAYCEY